MNTACSHVDSRTIRSLQTFSPKAKANGKSKTRPADKRLWEFMSMFVAVIDAAAVCCHRRCPAAAYLEALKYRGRRLLQQTAHFVGVSSAIHRS
ncbi:hypothetical protein BaRGS_00001975 [Batillaria attramentaria]|uniref:Uncharacterized protein n=1 Tax=Batillaria attramentaria TaxID=370345 RepID=A0ABD0M4B6_9CAEN